MPNARRDREQLVRLFTGEFGKFTDIYGNIALEGTVSDVINSVEEVFGLYSDNPQLRLYGFNDQPVDEAWFLARIPTYGFTKEEHGVILLGQAALLEESYPDWRSEAVSAQIWHNVQQALNDLGLPVSFFSRQVGLDGTVNVGFWYPRLVPAEGMLKVFQLTVSKLRPA